jgi:hypothetical protein
MASTGAEADKAKGLIPEWLVLCTNFGLWYAISACYNIYNKKALNNLHLPNLVATIQMATGIALFVPAWLLRLREAPFKSLRSSGRSCGTRRAWRSSPLCRTSRA